LCAESDSERNTIGLYFSDSESLSINYWKIGESKSEVVFDGNHEEDSNKKDGSGCSLKQPAQILRHQDKHGKTVGLFINDKTRIFYWKLGAKDGL